MQPDPSAPPIRKPRLRFDMIAGSTFLVLLGVYLNDALETDPRLADGLSIAAFYLVFTLPLIFLVPLVVFWLVCRLANIRRGGRSGRWILIPALLICLSLSGVGVIDHLPRHRFEKYVVSPMPSSVTGLRMIKRRSFGDGNAWAFSFGISPDDFSVIETRFGLYEIAVDKVKRTAGLNAELSFVAPDGRAFTEDRAWPEDHLLRRDAADIYTRPADARFYAGSDRTVVVTSGDHSRVWVYRNFWADPGER